MDNPSFDNHLFTLYVFGIYLLWLDPGSLPLFRSPSLVGDNEHFHISVMQLSNSFATKLIFLSSTFELYLWFSGTGQRGHFISLIYDVPLFSGIISISALGFLFWKSRAGHFGRLIPMWVIYNHLFRLITTLYKSRWIDTLAIVFSARYVEGRRRTSFKHNLLEICICVIQQCLSCK